MSVETIFKIALHPFVHESISSLRAMTTHHGSAGEAFMDRSDHFAFRGYAVATEISGSLDGVVLMHQATDTAVAIGNDVAHSMLGDMHEHTEVDEELGKALAEWGNTIVGRATDFLARHNLGFQFSAPGFVTCVEQVRRYFAGVKHVVTVPINVAGVGKYHFHLLVRGGSYERLQAAQQGRPVEAVLTAAKQQVAAPQSIAVPNTATRPLPFNHRILLVDDSALIRKAVHRFLVEMGYGDIVEVADGAQAVDAVADGGIDFVIMDVVMETMNGDEALRQMREINPKLPVLMLSSVTEQAVVDRCREIGISGFVFKPLNRQNGPAILRDTLKI